MSNGYKGGLVSRTYGYAAKFRAETICQEPPIELAPTDSNLAAILNRCVRPARVTEYPAIRAALADTAYWTN